ncbi:hypothetical protein JK161_02035 [Leuconostoc mesenteroides]|uniref:hypothetical protein n=1 Tax=Leuconostoc mesenteroides TaxID=1245 RepID=UPI001B8B521F|nr:hypothetical protein [Leuconostoc mesenteroides]MBS0941629.1 hypothetical protein [Leuconostoc mesenteroides]
MVITFQNNSNIPTLDLENTDSDDTHKLSGGVLPVLAAVIMSTSPVVKNAYLSLNTTSRFQTSQKTAYTDRQKTHNVKNVTLSNETVKGGILEMSDNSYLTDRDMTNLKDLIDASAETTSAKILVVDSKLDTISQKIDTSASDLKIYIKDEIKKNSEGNKKDKKDNKTLLVALLAIASPIIWGIIQQALGWK